MKLRRRRAWRQTRPPSREGRRARVDCTASREEDGPALAAGPGVGGHGLQPLEAPAYAGLAHGEVGDLDRGGVVLVFAGEARGDVVADGLDDLGRELVATQVVGADHGVVPAHERALGGADRVGIGVVAGGELGELPRPEGGEQDFADVVQQADDVVGVVVHEDVGVGEDLAGEDGGADGVVPELAPRRSSSSTTGVAMESSRIWRRPM